MQKKIEKILGIILNCLIFLVTIFIIIGIYYVVQIKLLKNNYANIFGYTFFEVATGSMSDTINIGDVVVTKITKDVSENDVIVYEEQNNFITHRLIEKKENELITKGDANNSEDKPIKVEQVLGKVIYVVPKVGFLKKILMSPQIIVGIVFLVIIMGFVLKEFSKMEEEK